MCVFHQIPLEHLRMHYTQPALCDIITTSQKLSGTLLLSLAIVG